jgi:hypothetical protein
MLVYRAKEAGDKRGGRESDISLLLVANRRHSVGRIRRVGGDEGLTADRLFLGFLRSGYRELARTESTVEVVTRQSATRERGETPTPQPHDIPSSPM